MDKRQFLQLSGTILTGTAASRLAPALGSSTGRTNWSGSYEYRAAHLQTPASAAELRKDVTGCDRVKALGARHSFNGIADTPGDQISVQHFGEVYLDRHARRLTVGAGLKYGQAAPDIDKQGFAFHNLASLPHISIVGACATATHGSGLKNGNLSTAVCAMDFVLPDGSTVHVSREQDGNNFKGMVVHLGALGVVTKLTLDLQPRFDVAQSVYLDLSIDQLKDNLHTVLGSGYSVSLFTDWQKHRITQVWVKRRVPENGSVAALPPELFGAKLAREKQHPIGGLSAENCTEQGGIPGPWYERLPHFRMNFIPSSGAELQSEYFVPLEHGYEAILAVEKLRDQITPNLLVTEFRAIDADDLWLSPAYKRPSMALHFTWKPDWPTVRTVLPHIEKQLEPFAARPHWAKLFTMNPRKLQDCYEKLDDFKRLIKQYDPKGKLRNDFLDKNLFA